MANGLDSSYSYKQQVSFSYQFLKFISWEPPLKAKNLVLCVLSGNAKLVGRFQTLNNRNSLWGRILVNNYRSPPSAGQLALCQMVYIDTGYPYHALRSQIVNGRMLTLVREDIDQVGLGVFIFLIKDKKLRFKVNLKQARRKGIHISASLLLLAVEVIEH